MTEKEIEAAIADIAEIRQTIQGKLKVIRPLFLDRAFAPFSLVFGIVIASLMVAVHLLGAAYGGFAAIPAYVKTACTLAITAILIASGLIKRRIITRALKRQDRSLTFFSLLGFREFREIYSLVALGFILVASGTGIVCLRCDASLWALLPVFSLYAGFIFALMSLAFRIPEFRILSLLAAAFGLAALAFMKGDHFLWLAAFTVILPGSYSLIVALAPGNGIERA